MPNNLLGLSREQLKKFLPDHQTIRAFEQLVLTVNTETPEAVEEATNLANTAISMAAAALSQLAEVIDALDQALSYPAVIPYDEVEDFAPNYGANLGNISYQNADDVEITGGSITGTTISGTTGSFTSITYSGQLTSTIATGTAPMVITSTTKVANLNVDLLDGADWASPLAIGTTAPQNGTFKQLLTDGTANALLGTDTTNSDVISRGSNSGAGGGASYIVRNNGVAIIGIGNKSRLLGTAYDATPYIFANATIEVHTGVKFLSTTGFNNTNPIAKPTITGSRAGNAALASLLTALANYGLVTDSTTA